MNGLGDGKDAEKEAEKCTTCAAATKIFAGEIHCSWCMDM